MVRPWVKIAGIIVVVGLIAWGLVTLNGGKVSLLPDKNNGDTAKKEKSDSPFKLFGGSNKGKKDYITVGVDTYGGHAPIVQLNGGLEPNENCELYKKYGIKLKFMIVENDRSAFKSGDIDVIFATTDVRPIEMGENSAMLDSKQFVLANKSEGADALVVDKTINTVADLAKKNVTIAYPEGQAGQTLLMEILETSGLKASDVNLAQWFVNGKQVKVANGMDAAEVMKAKQANAALVYSPDDIDLAKIPGNKILFTTKQAPNIIVDGYIANQSYIDNNKEAITKLAEAILYANSELATNDDFLKAAAKTFAKAFGVDASFICETDNNGRIVNSIRDVLRFATLADNVNFFGLNDEYKGMTGEQLYRRMAIKYQEAGLTKSPVKWGRTVDTSIIESLMSHNTLTNDQTAEQDRKYDAPSTKEITAKEVSNKKVIIEFNTNSAVLDAQAQNIIDAEFVPIAQNFTNYIRVEGNTDNTGSAKVNIDLSKRRAQAVVDYLVKQYSFDKNRFIVVGNGSKDAIANGSVGSDRNYRRTDFQLIGE